MIRTIPTDNQPSAVKSPYHPSTGRTPKPNTQTYSNMQPTGTNCPPPDQGTWDCAVMLKFGKDPPGKKRHPKKDRTLTTRPDQLQSGRVRQTPGHPHLPEKSYTYNTNLGDLAT